MCQPNKHAFLQQINLDSNLSCIRNCLVQCLLSISLSTLDNQVSFSNLGPLGQPCTIRQNILTLKHQLAFDNLQPIVTLCQPWTYRYPLPTLYHPVIFVYLRQVTFTYVELLGLFLHYTSNSQNLNPLIPEPLKFLDFLGWPRRGVALWASSIF